MGCCKSSEKPPEQSQSHYAAPSAGVPTPPPATNESVDDQELRQIFNEFDIDKDGSVQTAELKTMMQKLGQNPTDEDVKALFQSADKDGDGKISFEEFKAISNAKPLAEQLKLVFGELDIDKNGYLTKEEIKVAFDRMGHPLSEDEIGKVFAQVDVNHDGQVNCDEFIQIMTKPRT